MQMRWAMAVCASLGLIACGKPTPQVAPAPLELPSIQDDKPEAEVAVVAVAPDPVAEVAVTPEPAPAFDEAAYEQALIDHASCTLRPNGMLDSFCPGAQVVLQASFDADAIKVMEQTSAALGRRLINHTAPSVRAKAAEVLMNTVTPLAADLDLLATAAKAETNPAVLTAFVAALASHGATNPKVAELFLWVIDHADQNVGFAGVRALSDPANRNIKGGVEKLIAIMDGGSEEALRDAACSNAGNLGDAKLMPIYRKILLGNSAPDPHGACFKGLAAMWWSYPQHLSANEEAYRLTLQILSKKPRTEESPSWMVYDAFQLKHGPNFAIWKTRAPWYSESDFKNVLTDVVLDPNVNWLGRTGAVESLATIATKAELEAIRAKFPEKVSFEEGGVLRALKDAIFAAQ